MRRDSFLHGEFCEDWPRSFGDHNKSADMVVDSQPLETRGRNLALSRVPSSDAEEPCSAPPHIGLLDVGRCRKHSVPLQVAESSLCSVPFDVASLPYLPMQRRTVHMALRRGARPYRCFRSTAHKVRRRFRSSSSFLKKLASSLSSKFRQRRRKAEDLHTVSSFPTRQAGLRGAR
ncbi:hypothetical protein OH76DRAFT_260861 [Lentinus brumalis]|uniref:Uncharacterized protein n=1 Tax=Lentinus brumalis TaxID=2498619 RepID=A0A371DGH9_9APHY|nr:hypothetical protein OH76DRAFT_260861 [Polyporus brumalis]